MHSPGGERCGQARERSAYSCVVGGLSASALRARRSDAPSSGEYEPGQAQSMRQLHPDLSSA